MIKLCRANNVHLFVFPPNCTHLFQPLDVGVFQFFKAAFKVFFTSFLASITLTFHQKQILVWNQSTGAEQIDPYDLPSFTFLPWKVAATSERIKKAFKDCGLFPLDGQLIMEKPELDLAIPFHDPSREPLKEGPAPIRGGQPPLPSLQPLRDLLPTPAHVEDANFSTDDLFSRQLLPYTKHFFEINKKVLAPHLTTFFKDLFATGPAEPAPIFDDPNGPTASRVRIRTIGQTTHDILNTNNPEQSLGSPVSRGKKRGRSSALSLPSGGLLTADEIADKFHQQDLGTFSFPSPQVYFHLVLTIYGRDREESCGQGRGNCRERAKEGPADGGG